jgi:hypothetical protein
VTGPEATWVVPIQAVTVLSGRAVTVLPVSMMLPV